MDRFFDEAARILASPMSRRQAFRLLGGALVGGIVGAAGIKQAAAQGPPPPPQACGNINCASGEKCCPGRAGNCNPYCAGIKDNCCGCVRCPATQRCAAHDDTSSCV